MHNAIFMWDERTFEIDSHLTAETFFIGAQVWLSDKDNVVIKTSPKIRDLFLSGELETTVNDSQGRERKLVLGIGTALMGLKFSVRVDGEKVPAGALVPKGSFIQLITVAAIVGAIIGTTA